MQKAAGDPAQDSVIKIAVLGKPGVGKSSLIHQLTKWIFPEEYDPTIEDVWHVEVTVDGKAYQLELADYSGVVEEHSVGRWDHYIRNAHCIVLVAADGTPRHSWDSTAPVESIKEAVYGLSRNLHVKPHLPICFWYNKIDTIENSIRKTREQQVYAELSTYFKEACALPIDEKIVECPDRLLMLSAKTREGVDDAIHNAVRKAVLFKQQQGDYKPVSKSTKKQNRCDVS